MYHNYTRYKILQVFFDQPNKQFQLRQLSRITTISLPSVKHHVEWLYNHHLLIKTHEGVYEGYKASLTQQYKILKRNDLLLRLETTGLIQTVENKCTPNCIILYGSAVQGTDDERGDIDIFIQSRKYQIPLTQYEQQLHRTIHLLFEPNISKINKEMKNTLANGIIVSGYYVVV